MAGPETTAAPRPQLAHAGHPATQLGEDTPKRLGRVSLNPVVNIDPIGPLLLPRGAIAWGSGVIFGWAKPTPIGVRV